MQLTIRKKEFSTESYNNFSERVSTCLNLQQYAASANFFYMKASGIKQETKKGEEQEANSFLFKSLN